MFKNILLPVDLSDRHQPALDIATELARQSGGEITLLHVVELIAGLSVEEEKPFYNRLERLAQQHLERLGGQVLARGIACRLVVILGQRAAEIARYATEKSVNLIVLTAPRIDPARPAAGWGSLSYRVGILSQCPVLLVK